MAKSKSVTLLLPLTLAVLSTLLVPAHCQNLTFGELAKDVSIQFNQGFWKLLPTLTEKSKPVDVKLLRKSILYIRDSLDIFAASYPASTPDLWEAIRTSLDKGYTHVGDFQDLQFSDHSDKEEKEALDACLEWKLSYEKHAKEDNYNDFIEDPKDSMFNHTKSHGYYWKKTGRSPSGKLTGIQNVAMLTHDMGIYITKLLNDVLELAEHAEFHDFRKSLRSLGFIITFLPEPYTIFLPEFDPKPLIEVITTTRDNFGDLNDMISNYYYLKSHGAPREKLDKLEAEITARWDQVKSELESSKLVPRMEEMYRNLIPY